jgi:hypothetical protein
MSVVSYVEQLNAERDALMKAIDNENLPLACMTPTPERKYRVWKEIDSDERQYLIGRGYTLEADSELFAPRMVLGLNVEKLNTEVDAFIGKHGHLPRNVTKWNDPAPTN